MDPRVCNETGVGRHAFAGRPKGRVSGRRIGRPLTAQKTKPAIVEEGWGDRVSKGRVTGDCSVENLMGVGMP